MVIKQIGPTKYSPLMIVQHSSPRSPIPLLLCDASTIFAFSILLMDFQMRLMLKGSRYVSIVKCLHRIYPHIDWNINIHIYNIYIYLYPRDPITLSADVNCIYTHMNMYLSTLLWKITVYHQICFSSKGIVSFQLFGCLVSVEKIHWVHRSLIDSRKQRLTKKRTRALHKHKQIDIWMTSRNSDKPNINPTCICAHKASPNQTYVPYLSFCSEKVI